LADKAKKIAEIYGARLLSQNKLPKGGYLRNITNIILPNKSYQKERGYQEDIIKKILLKKRGGTIEKRSY